MFFQDYFTGLQLLLGNYVSSMLASVAAAIEPIFVAFATMYVMFWGYLQMTGRIDEPVLDGAKRIITVGVIFSVGLHMWSLHQVFVTAFLNGPQAFASTILHAQSPLAAVDSIWNQGNQIAQLFWRDAGVLNGNIGLFIAAGATWVIVGLLVVYTAFLFAFAAVALSVLLAVGPIFLMFLFFDSTKRFFEAWIAQLANYALIIIIASLIAALILNSVNNMAAATIGFGSDLTVLEAMNFFVLTILGFLLMRQVMSMASGLASGVALATGGLVSGIIRRGLGTTGRVGRGMWDAATGSGTTRWDPISRKAGYWSARGVGAVGAVTGRRVQAGWRKIRPNSIGQG